MVVRKTTDRRGKEGKSPFERFFKWRGVLAKRLSVGKKMGIVHRKGDSSINSMGGNGERERGEKNKRNVGVLAFQVLV